MPQFQVTSPDGAIYEVDAPEGATEQQAIDYVQSQHEAAAPPVPAASEQNGPTLGSQVGRQLGLTARAGVHAVTGLPEIVGNAANAAVDYGIRGANSLFGTKIPEIGSMTDAVDQNLSAVGLPEPQNPIERVAQVAGGALGGAGVAKLGARLLSSVPEYASLLGEFSKSPLLQTVGAGGGASAVEGARDNDIQNPYALMGIGMVGSLIPGAGASGVERALGGAAQLAAPFRSVGEGGALPGISREAIAGKVLNKLSTTPGLTPQVMDASQPILPGSNPTISQVSRDPGLMSAESGIRNALDNGQATSGRFAQRNSEQNAARNAALDRITLPSAPVPEGATPQRGTLEYAQAKRDRAVTQNRAAAFRGAGIADTEPVMDTINRVLSTPEGAKTDIQDAMEFAYNRLNQDRIDSTDPETLYAIRQDLADAKNGKYNSDKPNLARAGTQLGQVIGSLDNVIDQAAPGYRRYLDLYAKRSIPLDQQQAIQGLRNNGRVAVSDHTTTDPTPILTMGKFGVAARKAIANGSLGQGVGNGKLSESQLSTIANVTSDLDRGAAATASTIKPAGSDTFKNLSISNVIGRVVGDNFPDTAAGQAAQTIAKPLSWLYTMQDEKLGQLLVEAALNPQLAARLQRTASAHEIQSVATELAHRAAQQAKGAAVYNNPSSQ